MRKYLRLLPLGIFLLLVLAIAGGLLTPKRIKERNSPMIGSTVPAFTLMTLGKPGKLFMPSLWKGQVAVINIFASWCVPCRAEMPLLKAIVPQPGVNLYGIDWKDKPENLVPFLGQNGNPFREVGLDPSGQSTLLFGVTGLPETYVLDKRGYVRWKSSGPLTQDMVNRQLLPIVRQLNALP